ncbi:cytochrome P450 [Burkholderia vietnamiensis]|uniref:Cytochrome P450 n=1 Tax=Burkholderia vietnamiensis TaxID=60552 RepID=A0AAW7T948_BURVI|nr:cytochrome P450 [Burkholderia vietnamiensis]MDN7799296.1 cytochrome P450 [Burkholderia vietnamiensis]
MSANQTESEFNPLYEETFDNTHTYYEEMRKKCPVAHSNEFGGFWALFKYDDVLRLQEDTESFSTADQNIVPRVTRKDGPRPPLHFDPPEHATFRNPINRIFKKSRIDKLESTLQACADELLVPLVAAGAADFTKDFAEYFAARAFGEILALPLEMMLRARAVGVRYYRATTQMDQAEMIQASTDLYAIAREIVESRKTALLDPDEDLVSALLLAGERGKPISETLVVASIRQFLSAAQAAPGAVLGSIAVHLARDQALQSQLRADPELMPRAIEEFLRMYAPYRVFARTAKHDVEIRGRTIKAGEAITMMFPSANRDEDVFPNPHEFDMNRTPNRHIAFGRGAHQCPAASLARLELRIGIGALLQMTEQFELAGEVKMTDWVEFGPSSTPLRLIGRKV